MIVSFNRIANYKDWKQPGGTGMTITKDIASRKDKTGSSCDKTGLDRWTWVRIEGKVK